MNGGITVYSEPGYGSRFTFRMKVFKISTSTEEGSLNPRSLMEELKSNDVAFPNIERDHINRDHTNQSDEAAPEITASPITQRSRHTSEVVSEYVSSDRAQVVRRGGTSINTEPHRG